MDFGFLPRRWDPSPPLRCTNTHVLHSPPILKFKASPSTQSSHRSRFLSTPPQGGGNTDFQHLKQKTLFDITEQPLMDFGFLPRRWDPSPSLRCTNAHVLHSPPILKFKASPPTHYFTTKSQTSHNRDTQSLELSMG